MKSLFIADGLDLPAFGRNWWKFFLWGIALVILGVCAIGAAAFTTLLSIIVLGFLIAFGGGVILIDSFTSWWNKKGFFLHLIVGILYLAVGIMLINSPIIGSISITLLLGLFYLIIGFIRLFYASSLRTPRWGWNFFNGLISAILGALILMNWPASSLYIIGLFVGIDLLICGWAYIMASLGAKALSSK